MNFLTPLIALSILVLCTNAYGQGDCDGDCPDDGGGSGSGGTHSVLDLTGPSSPGYRPHNNGIFGDSTDEYTGTTTFKHTDVSIPGNFAIPVEVSRYYDPSKNVNGYKSGFGTWSLLIPSITTVVAKDATIKDINYPYRSEKWHYDRCSGGLRGPIRLHPNALSTSDTLLPSDYASGVYLHTFDGSSKKLLEPESVSEFGGTTPKYMTKDYWKFNCLSSIKNGVGEGFVASSPSGLTYIFDYLYYYDDPSILSTPEILQTAQAVLYVSEIRDLAGNWVKYSYGTHGPTRIYSSDGRDIAINYNSTGTIASVVANGSRTWQYTYINTSLQKVTLPDARFWEFVGFSTYPTRDYDLQKMLACDYYDSQLANGSTQIYDQYITHPDGLLGHFQFRSVKIGKKDADLFNTFPGNIAPPGMENCYFQAINEKPIFFSKALIAKSFLSGVDLLYQWTFDYEEDNGSFINSGSSIADTVSRTQIKPDGGISEKHFIRKCGWDEGLLKKEVNKSANGTVVSETNYSYAVGHRVGKGGSACSEINWPQQSYLYYLKDVVSSVGGMDYFSRFKYEIDPSSQNYAFGKPYRIEKWSSFGFRTTEIEYAQLKNVWVLNNTKKIIRNGKTHEEFDYDGFGRKTEDRQFGQVMGAYTYSTSQNSQLGTLIKITDALGRVTRFADYYRGIPRAITLPDNSTLSRTVDANGWMSSETNGRGYTFNYHYNTVGWLTHIDRPGAWNDTTFTYGGLGNGLIETKARGNLRVITTYDEMMRPVLQQTHSTAESNDDVFSKQQYDYKGRRVFSSFPTGKTSDLNKGIVTEYDVLGRVTKTEENVSPNARTLNEYLVGNKVKVTDPRGFVTTTTHTGYGSPHDGEVIHIESPENLNVAMTYDTYGNLLTVRQYGVHGGTAVEHTQIYSYDTRNRVCRRYSPEAGSTLLTYDAANQLNGYTEGQAGSTGCTSLPAGSRVLLEYDGMGRNTSVTFADSTPDIIKKYDANGNLKSVERGGVNWNYEYNSLDLITQERLEVDGKGMSLNYGYDAMGHLNSMKYPSGRTVPIIVNALGQTTRLGEYVTDASYHPNGALKAFRYGNGMTYATQLNDRQLVSDMYVNGGTGARLSDLLFAWNKNARMILSQDLINPEYTLEMEYDGLNRLTDANGFWGDGSISYDSFGNIRTKNLGSQTLSYYYDSRNRLDYVTGSNPYTFEYDIRGNVTDNGNREFSYNLYNQLIDSDGIRFAYDGHGRRVTKIVNGEKNYSIYGVDGKLYYRQKANGDHTDYLYLNGRLVTTVESR